MERWLAEMRRDKYLPPRPTSASTSTSTPSPTASLCLSLVSRVLFLSLSLSLSLRCPLFGEARGRRNQSPRARRESPGREGRGQEGNASGESPATEIRGAEAEDWIGWEGSDLCLRAIGRWILVRDPGCLIAEFCFFPAMAAAAASAFFPAPPSSAAAASAKASMNLGGGPDSLDARGIKSKPMSSSGAMQVRANAQAAPKINGTRVGLKTDSPKAEDEVPLPSAPRTFYNQLPDWSVLLAAITTIFLAAEKQWTLLDWKPKRPEMLADAFSFGRIIQDGMVFRQNFSIRSYEIGADRTASIETLMNHLQETALNHVKTAGLMGDGFGSTPEMSKRNLIWVVTKMQVLVEHYPSWGDVVEVDTWVGASGKNGMRRDWHVRDSHTGQTITRATSVWVMMNKQTRRLSKFPEEVRAEIEPYFVERSAIVDEDNRKLPKLDDETADYIRKGLTPRWGDLDINQHVNNVKYIGWILESAPISILENHELASMTLEYRRECGRDNVLQSLTAVHTDCGEGSPAGGIECEHLLRLESGAEIVRGRTEWRPKPSRSFGSIGEIPAESA